MRTGSLVVAISLAALTSWAVDVDCTWTAGETPDALADGKLQFTYAGEESAAKVATISANPGYGNRIVISGDTMALTANPTITVGAGTVVFSNALDGTGTLFC